MYKKSVITTSPKLLFCHSKPIGFFFVLVAVAKTTNFMLILHAQRISLLYSNRVTIMLHYIISIRLLFLHDFPLSFVHVEMTTREGS